MSTVKNPHRYPIRVHGITPFDTEHTVGLRDVLLDSQTNMQLPPLASLLILHVLRLQERTDALITAPKLAAHLGITPSAVRYHLRYLARKELLKQVQTPTGGYIYDMTPLIEKLRSQSTGTPQSTPIVAEDSDRCLQISQSQSAVRRL